jgi:PAS domain S-box-containing protein
VPGPTLFVSPSLIPRAAHRGPHARAPEPLAAIPPKVPGIAVEPKPASKSDAKPDPKPDDRLAVILEGIGDAFYALDRDWRFTYINRAAESFYGIPRDEMLGRVIWDIFPWSEGTDLRARYERVFLTGQAASFECRSVSSPDRHVELHVSPATAASP